MEPTGEAENGNRSGKNKAVSDGATRQEVTNIDALRQQRNVNGGTPKAKSLKSSRGRWRGKIELWGKSGREYQ